MFVAQVIVHMYLDPVEEVDMPHQTVMNSWHSTMRSYSSCWSLVIGCEGNQITSDDLARGCPFLGRSRLCNRCALEAAWCSPTSPTVWCYHSKVTG